MDNKITVEELKKVIKKFREDRNWGQFHDPKNLAEAISIEAGELQEKFLWRTVEDVWEKIEKDLEYKKEIEEELADILIFCINFANATEIDVSQIILDKIEKNNKKYSSNKSFGTAEKYNKL